MAKTVRGRLKRRDILEAAVRIVDQEGLEALSMRRLGAEVGVEAMSLYNHVPGKAALLDGMVEMLLGEVEVSPGRGSWEKQVQEAFGAFRRVALAHPNVFPVFVNRPPTAMDGLWLFEAFLGTLREAGFDPETALRAFRSLYSYTIGYAMAEIRGFALEPGESRAGVEEVPAEKFPHVAELKPHLKAVDHDAEFEFGLGLIISGLEDEKRA
jgi:TetR/AcrR family tetracycline transcriptional repressor